MSGGAARQMLMATTRRQGRVNHLLHKEISSLIEFESSDPRLHGVTVSAVEISPDLKHARVFVVASGDEQHNGEIRRCLRRVAPFFRHVLVLSWYALRLALRPAHAGKTYGYHRAGILVALVNSSVLIGLALVIFFQAYQRLLAPQPVGEAALIVVAALGFAINTGSAWLL